jgi:hypothetical protein
VIDDDNLSDFETIAVGILECANSSNKLWANQLITATETLQWPYSCMEVAASAGAKVYLTFAYYLSIIDKSYSRIFSVTNVVSVIFFVVGMAVSIVESSNFFPPSS